MKWHSWSALNKWLLLALSILVLNAVLTIANLMTLSNSDGWVTHTITVSREIERMIAAIRGAETNQRGYLLTGDVEYLVDCRDARSDLDAALEHLADLTVDNPRQHAAIPDLRKNLEARLSQMAEVVRLQDRNEPGAAIQLIKFGIGRGTMIEVERLAGAMMDEEDRLLRLRKATARTAARTTIATFSIANVAAVLLVGVALYLTRPAAVARRQVEAKLLGEILESAPDAMVVVDEGGRIVLVNAQTERFFGYTREELIGREVEVLLPERYRAAHTGLRRGFLSAPRAMGEVRALYGLRKGGVEFPAEISLSPIKAEGRVMVSAVIRDVTERKRVEETLARQARLIDIARDCIMVRNLDGSITFWNIGAESLYGWKSAEAVGQISHSLLGTRFPEPLEEIEAKLEREGLWEGELVHRDRNGRETVVSSSWVLQRDERGRPISVLEINNDVTERKRVELWLRGLLESAPDAMVVVDEGGRIVLVNAQTEKFFGYTREELIGREVEVLLPERYRAAHPGLRRGFLSAPQSMGEVRALSGLRKGGGEFPAEISLGPIKTDEGVVICAAIRDVTERKRADEVLRLRTAQLEASNKELESFSYSVSHDLRAPLRAIDGFSRILLEDCAERLSDEAKGYLNSVRDNARQMGRLVDDLLAFSRLSRQPIQKRTLEPRELVEKTFDELRGERDGRRVEIAIGDLPACEAEPALLKQVWLNLLSNAIKYTRRKEVAMIEIGCRDEADPPGERAYYVRDNGVGFDMRHASKLFGVFQRLHRAEDYEGTGVGLAIVQRIIHRHGGRVWAKSEPGMGATFYFTLGGPVVHA